MCIEELLTAEFVNNSLKSRNSFIFGSMPGIVNIESLSHQVTKSKKCTFYMACILDIIEYNDSFHEQSPFLTSWVLKFRKWMIVFYVVGKDNP